MNPASSDGGGLDDGNLRKRTTLAGDKSTEDSRIRRLNPSAEIRATSDESDAADAVIAGERSFFYF